MMFSWFAFLREGERLDSAALDRMARQVALVPGLQGGLVLSALPEAVAHPFPGDEPAPPLVLQLQFGTIEALESAAVADGPLARLFEGLPPPTHQAMLRRRYPVPDATVHAPPGGLPCSFLVHYPGAATDLNAWLGHYNTHHPPLMARFPGVRLIEIYTRIDWVSTLPWARENAMQRNKLLFDSPAALSSALMSPALVDMRADFNRFPAFTGGNAHYALETRAVGAHG